MRRNAAVLANNVYDVLVIGGGIYGAAVAWDAVRRGFTAALVEKGDFGGRTSANSLRVVHGGLRYLQSLDVARMRQSVRERRALMRIAPHLVRPLPVLMPTYRMDRSHGASAFSRGRAAMRAALWLNDLVSIDRNEGLTDRSQKLPAGRLVSREECLRRLPGVRERGLTGAALWHDAHMASPERLTLAFLLTASRAGADVFNHMEVTGFLQEDDRVVGARLRDALSGEAAAVRAKVVVNATGPWALRTLRTLRPAPTGALPLTRAMNLLIRRPLLRAQAAGVYRPGGQALFLLPWKGATLAGTWHTPFSGDPEESVAPERDVVSFLAELNRAYPGAALKRDDVSAVFSGLLPGEPSAGGAVRLWRRPLVVDHRLADGVNGLITLVGVKYTTARLVAEEAVDLALRKMGRSHVPCRTQETPLAGGYIEDVEGYVDAQTAINRGAVPAGTVRRLVLRYGCEYKAVLRHGDAERRVGAETLAAEVLHAAREEMARTLADAALRRTELAALGHPGTAALEECSRLMGRELGWDEARRRREIEACEAELAARGAAPAGVAGGV